MSGTSRTDRESDIRINYKGVHLIQKQETTSSWTHFNRSCSFSLFVLFSFPFLRKRWSKGKFKIIFHIILAHLCESTRNCHSNFDMIILMYGICLLKHSHVFSRVPRDSTPRFVRPLVGRSVGQSVGPNFTFFINFISLSHLSLFKLN